MGTQEHSPNVFLVMYDAEIGKDPLLKAIEDYKCEIKYDYSKINGMALKKPTQAVENETETTALTEAVDSINQQTRKRCGPAFKRCGPAFKRCGPAFKRCGPAFLENMKEVQAYLKECGAFFIATVDGDQPHVRAFGVSEIINDRLYIITLQFILYNLTLLMV